MEIIPYAQVFWSYVILEWVPKCEMWMIGNHDLPYTGQDTNANLKATLRVAKSRLFGRQVD
jgi:hypothetical protein